MTMADNMGVDTSLSQAWKPQAWMTVNVGDSSDVDMSGTQENPDGTLSSTSALGKACKFIPLDGPKAELYRQLAMKKDSESGHKA